MGKSVGRRRVSSQLLKHGTIDEKRLRLISLKNGQEVSWVGLDENGLAIVKSNAKELFLSPVDISEQFGDIDLT